MSILPPLLPLFVVPATVEVVVLFVGAHNMSGFWQKPQLVGILIVSIFVIYMLTCIIDLVQNTADAKIMNAKLMELKERC